MSEPITIQLKVQVPGANPQSQEHIKHLVLKELNSPYIEVEVIEKEI